MHKKSKNVLLMNLEWNNSSGVSMFLYLILITSNNVIKNVPFLTFSLLPVSEVKNCWEIDADLPATSFTCGVSHTHLSFE